MVTKCRNPFIKDGSAYACGQCMPCRVAKRSVWTHRLILESLLHPHNCMATLTYSDEKMPRDDEGRGVLSKRHVELFLKKLRRKYEPLRFRFYCAGEYGDTSWRPHYHLALFNYPNCAHGISRYKFRTNCCSACDFIRDTWGNGNIQLNELNNETAQYICGYVIKKMTAPDDNRLKGLPPEFTTMSRMPGLGHDMIWDLASDMMSIPKVDNAVDVPKMLRHGGRLRPLGPYLTRKLRKYMGRDEKAPQEILDQIAKELQPLRETAFENSQSLKAAVIKAADQAVLNMETRHKMRKGRDVL